MIFLFFDFYVFCWNVWLLILVVFCVLFDIFIVMDRNFVLLKIKFFFFEFLEEELGSSDEEIEDEE